MADPAVDPGNPFAANPDDAAPGYLTHRQQVADDDAMAALREMAGQVPLPAAAVAPAAAAAPPASDQPGIVARVAHGAGAVAKDVMLGGVEAPKQAVLGAVAGYASTANTVNDMANWMGEFTTMDRLAGKAQDFGTLTVGGEAKTVTGGVIRAATQFAVGMATGGRELKALGWMKDAGPAAVRWARTAIQGGLASAEAFDTAQARIADLWKTAGLPQNELTDYLAADPADTGAEARFKMFIDGTLPGLVADGVFKGVKLFRAWRGTRAAAAGVTDAGGAANLTDPLAEMRAKYGEVKPEEFGVLGDPAADVMVAYAPPPWEQKTVARASAVAGDKLAAADAAVAERGVPTAGGPATGRDEKVYINFARINAPDDIQVVIGQMADHYAAGIDAARRGVQSNETTAALARDLGMTPETLLQRRRGEPLNAEQAVAARQLLVASGQKLVEAARLTIGPGASDVDRFNFRRMLALHNAIQTEVIAARTETARALQSWAMPTGGGVEQSRAIQMMLDGSGGAATADQIAKDLAKLADNAPPEAVNTFARKAWSATTVEVLREVWINGLLSSPHTHIVNTFSNLIAAGQQIYERKAAEAISAALGTEGGVAPGEAAAMAFGEIGAINDAFRLSWKALQTGASEDLAGTTKADALRPEPAISAKAWNLDEAGGLGRTVDVLGTVFNAPSRLLMSEDAFFKTIGYRAELRAQALRQATAEGKTGADLADRVVDLIDNPPDNLRLASADSALYATFTNEPGKWGQAIIGLRKGIPPVTLFLPFVKTPSNILRYSLERTPFALTMRTIRDDVAAGGARRDLALARMGTGSAIMAMAADWASSGQVTGSRPKDASEAATWDRLGLQEYSVRVGDRWYSYNRADPFGFTLGIAADMTNALTALEVGGVDVDQWDEIAAFSVAAVANTAMNKTYLQGLAQITDAMHDPNRYLPATIEKLVASFVPFTSLAGAIENVVDPAAVEINSPYDAVAGRIAGLSATLTPKRDLWGEPITRASGLGPAYDFLSPIGARQLKDSPIDAELARINYFPSKIDKRGSWNGVPVDLTRFPQVYDAYVQLAGNGKIAAWNAGARDVLDQAVQGAGPLGDAYAGLTSDYQRQQLIAGVIETSRATARAAIEADPQFGDFVAYVGAQRDKLVDRRTGGAANAPATTPLPLRGGAPPTIGGRP